MSDLPAHISIWGELADTDHELRHVDVGGVRTRVLRAGAAPTWCCCTAPAATWRPTPGTSRAWPRTSG